MKLASIIITTGLTLLSLQAAQSPPSLAALTAKLNSTNAVDRRAASEQIGSLGPKGLGLSGSLVEKLKDSDVMVRATSAWALGKIGSKEDSVVQALIAATGDANWTVRHNAGLSLYWIGPSTVPQLQSALNGSNSWTRVYAAEILLKIDPSHASSALGPLKAALNTDNVEMQSRAAAALAPLGPKAAVAKPELIAMLLSKDEKLRIAALPVISKLGSEASSAIPILAKMAVEEAESANRAMALSALAELREPASEIVPVLIKGLKDKKDQPKMISAQALASFGASAIPGLVVALEDKTTQLEVLITLGKMGAVAESALPAIVKLAASENWEVRLKATSALGGIGKNSPEVISALQKAAQDQNETVRSHAEDALKKLKT